MTDEEFDRFKTIDAVYSAPATDDTPRPWDGDREPFDPVRAGFDEKGWAAFEWGDGGQIDFSIYGEPDGKARLWVHVDTDEGSGLGTSNNFFLPADLPHNVVVSILRANGYEGGGDE